MTKNYQYTKEEVTSIVKKFGGGGAYISVPSSWVGGTVKAVLLRVNTLEVDLKEPVKKFSEVMGTPG